MHTNCRCFVCFEFHSSLKSEKLLNMILNMILLSKNYEINEYKTILLKCEEITMFLLKFNIKSTKFPCLKII